MACQRCGRAAAYFDKHCDLCASTVEEAEARAERQTEEHEERLEQLRENAREIAEREEVAHEELLEQLRKNAREAAEARINPGDYDCAATHVLQAVPKKYGHTLELSEGLRGGIAIHKTGAPFLKEAEALALQADATLMGAVGLL